MSHVGAMIIRIVVGLVLLVVVLAAMVFVVGSRLPDRHVATRSVIVSANTPEVFARASDVSAAATWRSGVTRVEIEETDSTGAATRYREHSGDGIIRYEVVERETDRRLVTRIADPSLPFGGRWIHEFRPVPTGTEVTITEEGEVYNPVFRFVSRYVMGHTRSIDRYLTDLQASLAPGAT